MFIQIGDALCKSASAPLDLPERSKKVAMGWQMAPVHLAGWKQPNLRNYWENYSVGGSLAHENT